MSEQSVNAEVWACLAKHKYLPEITKRVEQRILDMADAGTIGWWSFEVRGYDWPEAEKKVMDRAFMEDRKVDLFDYADYSYAVQDRLLNVWYRMGGD